LAVLTAAVYALALIAPGVFSPIVSLCYLLNGAVATFALVKYFLPRLVPVGLLVLGGLVLLGGVPAYKDRFPGLDYDHPVSLDDYARWERGRERAAPASYRAADR